MKPKIAAIALAMTAAVGCTPIHLALRRNEGIDLAPVKLGAEAKAQGLAPKRCNIRVVALSRPLGEPILNDVIFRVADEQAVPDDLRRALTANGLRIALVPAALPGEITEILSAPPPHQIDPTMLNVPSGQNTLLPMSPTIPKVSLIMNLDGNVSGRDYEDAHAFFRLTASHDPSGGVALRFVPELHHGPNQRRYAADDATNPFALQQFVLKDGQQEDTLRELATTLVVRPNQMVVLGCMPDRPRSLGHCLFTEPEANSDRLLQKVLLVWASEGALEPLVTARPTMASAAQAQNTAQAKAQPPAENNKTDRSRRKTE
ncbi:MAG TPA: hypothetical protein VGY53_02275 [Isosphaeraceae bacterium]|jgi:hypothetical protein|nr:hypothetical protein [Isosphaeraceae bacterium]